MAKKFKITSHQLVPKHSKLSEKDKKALLEHYNITLKQLPKILIEDPSLDDINVKENDVIKVERVSPTAGKSVFYRRVTHA